MRPWQGHMTWPYKRLSAPQFRTPPMPRNYILADASGPIIETILNEANPHYHKTGVISRVDNDHRLVIDQMYTFESSSSLAIHKVNDYVLYECYDGASGALVIVKIQWNYGHYRARPDDGRAEAQGHYRLIDPVQMEQIEASRRNDILMRERNMAYSLDNAMANFVHEQEVWVPLNVARDQIVPEVVSSGPGYIREWEPVPEPSPPLQPVPSPNCFHSGPPDYAVPRILTDAATRSWRAVRGTNHYQKCKEMVKIIQTVLPFLLEPLNSSNYMDKWHAMLFLDELQFNMIRGMHIPPLVLIRFGEFYGIQLHPFPYGRPEVLNGCGVSVAYYWNPDIPPFEGHIHHVKGDLVLIKLSPDFHESYTNSLVSVEFKTYRAGYRRGHEAVDLAWSILGPNILFVDDIESRESQIDQGQISTIKWFNVNLYDDQKAAVTNILKGKYRPFPYCIYGPRRTGKTTTLIETILQIIKLIPDSRILVATPSNYAANLVAEKLTNSSCCMDGLMIRLVARYLMNSNELPGLNRHCFTLDVGQLDRSTVHIAETCLLKGCRVIIGTCSYLGKLAQAGLQRGHFTHVIVDDAGHASEPETMIPLTYFNKENGQIILAGDPQQWKPVVNSFYNKELGMNDSYLSRILKNEVYKSDDGKVVSTLKRQVWRPRLRLNYTGKK